MNKFRYASSDIWWKGNTHIHSTHSDGGKTVHELALLYAGAGYDFIFLTDHWHPWEEISTHESGIRLFPGIELDGKDEEGSYYHVVCLGECGDLKDRPFPDALGTILCGHEASGAGRLAILAHPYWCGNTPEEVLRHGFHGMEVYNHVCRWLNGKGDSSYLWDYALAAGPDLLGFAADDTHLRPEHPTWNGGWVMVQAASPEFQDIMAALKAGRFYGTTGPLFRSIRRKGNTGVLVETTPVRYVRCVGPGPRGMRKAGLGDDLLEAVEFDVPEDLSYARIEIEDANGKRAWTNTLFLD